MTDRSYDWLVILKGCSLPLSTFFNLPDEKRQKIIDCALDEFSEHDYESASISKVVANAGIAKGSLYQYFKDKSDLYNYLLELVAETKARMMHEAFPQNDDLPFFDRLRLLFSVMTGFEIRYPKLASIGNKSLNGRAPMPANLIARGKQVTISYFADLIRSGISKGEINSKVDAEVAAFIFVSALSEIGNFVLSKQAVMEPSVEKIPLSLQLDQMETLYLQMIEIFKNGIAS
jgi:AcrR family transcriptional regulator